MLKNIVSSMLLVLTSITLTFAVVELGVRIYFDEFSAQNFLDDHIRILMAAYPTRYDEHLGWVAREGVSEANDSGARITILDNGVRSNGERTDDSLLAGRRPIVAVGDSFTFGYEVSDAESWPAILERGLGRRVINGGVFAYGMDQSLIRLRQLIKIHDPEIVIYSFIPDDIWRCQISARDGVNKPYFDIRDGALILKNSPVPRPALTDHGDPGVRRILGYSLLIHKLMMQSRFALWWVRGDRWDDKPVHSDLKGDKIACLIVRELDQLAENNNVRIILLAQYGRNIRSKGVQRSKGVIRCADPQSLIVVDLHEPLRDVWSGDREKYRSYFTQHQHMTYEGNKFVAAKLSEVLEQSGSEVP